MEESMSVNDVIILDNDEKYTLISEINYENSRYFLAMPVEEDDKINENKLYYFKEVCEDNEYFVDLVEDENLITILSTKLKDSMQD